MVRSAIVLVMAFAAASCGCENLSDPFPILVGRADGAFVVDLRVDGTAPRTAVVDVLSPLTVIDQDPAEPPSRRATCLDVLAPRSSLDPTAILRARWCDATVLHLRPCDSDQPCEIGAPADPRPIGAVIGADVMGGNAISFEPATDRMRVLPGIAGDASARGRACDVVVPAPFYGGGTLRVGDTEIGFTGRRIALGVCLSPDPTAVDPTARGTDAALVLSTGIGISILGEARYTAWARATGAPALETLPPAVALLPSGPVDGLLGRIDRLAIVGTASAPRSACREVFAHHLLAARDCQPSDGEDCPCTDTTRCQVAAIAELAPTAPIEVVVVNDRHPVLQALRAELRPEQPEVDGILGVNALDATAFDVDYPNNRLLFRCVGAGCVARPAFTDVKQPADNRAGIARCVAAAPVL